MAVEVIIKKWGNSLGLVLPKEFVEKRGIKADDRVGIEVFKIADLSKVFGILKGKKVMSGQKFKDLAREGWN